MTTGDGSQPVAVDVGACRCDGAPHASDSVYLAPEPSLSLGLAANGAIAAAGEDPARLEITLGRVFIEYGIIGWTFVEDGEPVPVNPASIERLLPWGRGGSAVAEKANDLYAEAILRPLLEKSLTSSRPGRTNGSTSVTRPSRSARRSSSKSSSPAPSATPR
jgi:hypothetical protein